MALTRKFLAALGIEDAQADEIIENHTSTVSNIKAELEKYKAEADKVSEAERRADRLQKELDELKAERDDEGNNEFESKYNELKQEFDDYKESIKKKEEREEKVNAFKELLKEANIPEKRFNAILKLSDDEIDKLEFDEDGVTIKGKDELLEDISKNWSEYIQKTETEGAHTATPPANNGGENKKISRARQIAQQYHDDLYGKVKED